MGSEEMDRWQGRVALVTGASSGIGAAVAVRLARHGMRVVACARRQERLLAMQEAPGIGGGHIDAVVTDLRREEDILRLFEHVRAEHGGVDVLINNAGLGHAAPLLNGNTEAWREMLEVNVLALCVCTREAVADMRARGDDGHVVHIASMAAHRVPPGSGVYSATKFAVRSLTEGLRQELRAVASRIRVSQLSPGYVETEFHQVYHRDPRRLAELKVQMALLTPDDVANAVVYLLSQPPHVQVHDILMRPTEQSL